MVENITIEPYSGGTSKLDEKEKETKAPPKIGAAPLVMLAPTTLNPFILARCDE